MPSQGKAAQGVNATRQTILAVHPGALGDVILFGRLLEALDGEVTLAAGGQKARLLKGLGVVGRALDFDSLPMHEVFTDTPPGQCRLRGLLGGHDRLISCFAAGEPHAQERLAAIAGASVVHFLPVRPPANFTGHLVDHWRQMLGEAPCGAAAFGSTWPVPASWRDEARQHLRSLGLGPSEKYWIIHPGAGSPRKCWPLERFLALACCHECRPLGRAIFVLGPVECERWPDEARRLPSPIVRGDMPERFPTLVCPPLTTLAGALAGANAFVGNDSGVSHLAAAVGADTVAVFVASQGRHFAPLGRRVQIVSGHAPAGRPSGAAAAGLPVEPVLEALLRFSAQSSTGNSCREPKVGV